MTRGFADLPKRHGRDKNSTKTFERRKVAGERVEESVVACGVGNTSTVFGWFAKGHLKRRWRVETVRLNRFRLPQSVRAEAIYCSVVPAANRHVAQILEKATGRAPRQLSPLSPHGLRIAYRDPSRFGADRLAAALGARARFPSKDLIVVDCGTATTLTAVSRKGEILGGAILPGASLWPAMLACRTAQLPEIRLRRPQAVIGHSPEEAIAAGIWFGHVGAVRHLLARMAKEAFGRRKPIIIATGGNAESLASEQVCDVSDPDLVLKGILAFSRGI